MSLSFVLFDGTKSWPSRFENHVLFTIPCGFRQISIRTKRAKKAKPHASTSPDTCRKRIPGRWRKSLKECWHMIWVGLIFLNVHPYLGMISNLTKIFQMSWNHKLENHLEHDSDLKVMYIRQKRVCKFQSFWFEYTAQQWVGIPAKNFCHRFWESALASKYHPECWRGAWNEVTLYTRLEAGYNIAVNCCVLSGKCDEVPIDMSIS